MYDVRGKIVSESFYKQLIIHCPTSKTFFKEHNYECKAVKQYGKKRRPPITHVVADDSVLKILQNRDGLKKDGSEGGGDAPQQHQNPNSNYKP